MSNTNIEQLTNLVNELSLKINNINIIPLDQKVNNIINTTIPNIQNEVSSIKSDNSNYQINHNNLNYDLKTQTTNLQTIQKQNNINSNNVSNLNTLHSNLSNKLNTISNNNLNNQYSQSSNKTMIDNLNNYSTTLTSEIQAIKLNLQHIKTQMAILIPNSSQHNSLDSNYNNLSSSLKQVQISTIIAQQEQNINYSLLESLMTASNSERPSLLGNTNSISNFDFNFDDDDQSSGDPSSGDPSSGDPSSGDPSSGDPSDGSKQNDYYSYYS
jgi:chromosome segregation ATPase